MATYPKEIEGHIRSYFQPNGPTTPGIHYLNGNASIAIPAVRPEYVAILQVCNDVGAYGAGFSGEIEKRYPGVRALYKKYVARKTGPYLRGSVQYIHVDDYVVVVNMIAQRGYRARATDPPVIDYSALTTCLSRVAYDLVKDYRLANHGWTIQMPRIGCGLAGGDWSKVENIIQLTLCAAGASPYVYDYQSPREWFAKV